MLLRHAFTGSARAWLGVALTLMGMASLSFAAPLGKIEGQLPPVPKATASKAKSLAGLDPRTLRVNARQEVEVALRWGTDNGDLLARLEKQGLRLERVNRTLRMAEGWVAPAALEALAAEPEILQITPPGYARVRNARAKSGTGTAPMADTLRPKVSVDGTSVTIGLISDGIDSLDTLRDAKGSSIKVTVDPELPGEGTEGRQLVEIIHAIAPGAVIAFSGPRTKLEFIDALNYLVDVAGCDIVIDDLGFYDEPYFQDGIIADAVAAVSERVVYVSAAGNDGQAHYQAPYSDSNPVQAGWAHDLHDFGGGANTMRVTIPPQTSIALFLQWSEPFDAASSDYDLYLYNDDLSAALSWSNAIQDGDDRPYEALSYTNSTDETRTAYVVINLASGAARTLELFSWDLGYQQFATAGGAIFGHPALSNVLSVGAVNCQEPQRLIDAYSSQGYSRVYYPVLEERRTPSLVGWDGIGVDDGSGTTIACYGTSAAAAHVAGLAALVRQSSPDFTPAQIREQLSTWAEDLGLPGYDNAYGAGLARFISNSAQPGWSLYR